MDTVLTVSVDKTRFASFFGSLEMTQAWMNLLKTKTRSQGMVQKGLCALQMQQWRESFAREQFLAVSLPEAPQHATVIIEKMHSHLGIPRITINDTTPHTIAPRGDIDGEPPTVEEVSDRIRTISVKLYQPFDNDMATALGECRLGNAMSIDH